MRIVLSDIPIYCLTCDPEQEGREWVRKKHMEDIIQPEFVMPIIGMPKNKSGATGFFQMVERGLKAQVRGEPFKPFLLLEDDVSFSTHSTNLVVDVPDDADFLYIGLSHYSMNDYMFHYATYYEGIQGFPDIVRIKHMLATHGIMVCSALGASVIQRTMLEVFLSDKALDIPLAYVQPFYNVYALRRPWIYKDSVYNGDDTSTKITLEGEDNVLRKAWLSKNYATISMREP
jgi:hypothetical protein